METKVKTATSLKSKVISAEEKGMTKEEFKAWIKEQNKKAYKENEK